MTRTFRNTLFTMFSALILAGCAQNGGNATVADTPRAPFAVTPSAPVETATAPQANIASTQSCSSLPSLGQAYNRPIRRNSFDPVLFEKSVLHYTNVRRCNNGLQPLAADATLSRVANGHSNDMVELGFFSHKSLAPGRTTLRERMDAGGVKYSAFAENLASRSRLQLESGRPYTVQDAANCGFSYDGVPIEAHTYRSLGETFVSVWEASPGHRKNLLNPTYTRLGVGGSYKRNARNCGDIVATQNFAA